MYGQQILRSLQCPSEPVSYTHLDVYKRQEEHCYRVEYVLSKLAQNNITLKLEKSKFIAREVQFLGFNLDDRGITPSAEKVEAILKFPQPRNRKQLQSFLGLCNYYRKIQNKYSELTAKVQPQLSAKNKWTWGEEQDLTFRLIKEKNFGI